ncbi:hypothetical protein G7070_10610 [Propioniciclava coleopterorum]|uniref:Uncharacterized protein n=1 Tax=Propioniciclava coleopterorum TaxID=2714937 RepID=A0A6G7Y7P7_9ACTN|nr:hypothetical protein [Propioniciclava coleopterorum]QIK72637.1 hypothetical protein G7070_10610 [Propioniciclava coleopterorum]
MPSGPSRVRLTVASVVQFLIPVLIAGGIAALGLWLELGLGWGPFVRTVCLVLALIVLGLAFPRRGEGDGPPPVQIDTPLDPTPHPRLRDTLTEAARAARVAPPERLALDGEPALRVDHDRGLLRVGVPTLALLTTDQFRALLTAELSAAGGGTDPFGERLTQRAARADLGWILKLRAAVYRAIAGTGEHAREERATRAAGRIAPRTALTDARAVLARAAEHGAETRMRLDLFDHGRARASMAEAHQRILAASPGGFAPRGELAVDLLDRGLASLTDLEDGLLVAPYPAVGWDEVAQRAGDQLKWLSMEEILDGGQEPTPRSVLTDPAFVGADFEWELLTASRVALGVRALRIDWSLGGDDHVVWDDPPGLAEALRDAVSGSSNEPLRAFIAAHHGDEDLRLPRDPDERFLAASAGLNPVEDGRIDRGVVLDAFVHGDGVLVLPAAAGPSPFERVRAVVRAPRAEAMAAPGARWFPASQIWHADGFDGLRLELGDGTVTFDTGVHLEFPAYWLSTALAEMLIAAGRDRSTAWSTA